MTQMAKRTPGGGLGYVWENAGDVVDVDPAHVHDLTVASHGDIYEVAFDPSLHPPIEPGDNSNPSFDAPPNDLASAIHASSATRTPGKRPTSAKQLRSPAKA